jgi:putative tricarboxylic transport membrane protein
MSRYLVPVGLIVFCGLTYWQSTQFDRVPPILLRGMQPADFPQMVLLLIVGLCAILLFQAWRSGPPEPTVDDGPEDIAQAMSPSVWKTMGLFIIFAAIAPIDLFLGLGVFALCLTAVWGERRIWALLLVSTIAPLLIFFLFDQVFEIRFPRGLLTNLWYG